MNGSVLSVVENIGVRVLQAYMYVTREARAITDVRRVPCNWVCRVQQLQVQPFR